MRAVLLSLLLLNLALYAWLHGWFGTVPVSGREPSRLEQQVAAERIRVLTDREVQQLERRAGDAAGAAAATASALAQDVAGSCVQIGEFVNDAQLARLREKLAEMKLVDRAAEQSKELPGWYQVYLPPARSLTEAEQRADQLRAQGVRELLVMKEEGELRYSIGLGAFRDRDLALKQVTQLERRGVKGARVADKPTTVRSTRVLIRGADAPALQQLEALQKEFPQQKVQPCGAEPTS
ncbi:MAG TPA: SPOR domain-containing protein [Burkholderiaceae bacterium]|nr:SPOR domain-containing protein [Burkholderiaceae bacterium]